MTSATRGKGSTGDPEVTRIVSLNALADRVEELAAQLTGGAGGGRRRPDDSRETSGSGSLDEQVERAVQAAKEREAAKTAEEQRQKEIDDRIKGLEERTEKRPTERSALTRWMWGDD